MLYFAYGSNLDWRQMKCRCRSARSVGRARLNGYRLDFTHESSNRGCGVADVIAQPSSIVWGVLYEIPDDYDVARLDASEGYHPGGPREGNTYERITLTVEQVDDAGTSVAPRAAQVYVIVRKQENCHPDRAYRDLIVNGGRFWNLPEDYVAQIAQVPLQETAPALGDTV